MRESTVGCESGGFFVITANLKQQTMTRHFALLLAVMLTATGVQAQHATSRLVPVTDVVPDAILEIRYYGTYNFVGKRIDGYE